MELDVLIQIVLLLHYCRVMYADVGSPWYQSQCVAKVGALKLVDQCKKGQWDLSLRIILPCRSSIKN